MAIVWVNVTLGSPRTSGERNVIVSRGGTQTGDVTVAIDNTRVKSKGDLLAACKAAADHLVSDTLK